MVFKKKKDVKERVVKKKGPKLKLEDLKNIVQDGRLLAEVNTKVVFENLGEIHEGWIKSIDETSISIWDDTRDQFFLVGFGSERMKKICFDPR